MLSIVAAAADHLLLNQTNVLPEAFSLDFEQQVQQRLNAAQCVVVPAEQLRRRRRNRAIVSCEDDDDDDDHRSVSEKRTSNNILFITLTLIKLVKLVQLKEQPVQVDQLL